MSGGATTLITDFDNTLYDWVHMWEECFGAMLKEIVKISGIDESILLPEIRAIHQKYHTSEYAFLIEEIPTIKEKFAGQNIRETFDEAIHAYRKARKTSLRLYDGVLDTLLELKKRGITIVVYTESLAYYTNYRIGTLGLEAVVDFVYSPPDHEIPAAATGYGGSLAQNGNGGLARTRHRFLPKGLTKPNPVVLLDIIRDIGRTPAECVYVGDSLMKDIAMAQEAGVVDVLASYGAAQQRPGYDLLRKVSHWTEADVQREKEITKESITPTYSISKFSAIAAFLPPQVDKDRLLRVIDIWKYVVSVQMHFNDMEMRVRNLYFTVLAASLGLIGVSQGKKIDVISKSLTVPLSLFVFAAIVPISLLFYFIDRHWYHRLLQGSVNQAIAIETKYETALPEIQLGLQIKKESPVEFKGYIWKVLFFFVGDPRFRKDSKLHSDAKIEVLYKSVIWGSIGIIVAYSLFGGVRLNDCAVIAFPLDKSCRKTKIELPSNSPAFTLFEPWGDWKSN